MNVKVDHATCSEYIICPLLRASEMSAFWRVRVELWSERGADRVLFQLRRRVADSPSRSIGIIEHLLFGRPLLEALGLSLDLYPKTHHA